MALRYMLDTNTCSYVLKAGASSKLAGHFNRHADQICISSIVLAEMHYGAENSQRVAENLAGIEQFVARLNAVLDFDAAAAADFGRIKTLLRRMPIGPFDTLIASHARSRDLIIVTNNTAEFGRVPGLLFEDWI
jgi:tRNA(fMet)-specific endonuclease VapC